jgi:hypothetical protein
MVEGADWDCVFVTDLAAERARLSKANVVRFGGRETADNAWLGGDEFAVHLVSQTDGLRLKAATSDSCRCRSGPLGTAEGLALLLRVFGAWVADCLRYPRSRLSFLDRGEQLSEAGFDSLGIGEGQSVLSREVLLDPSRRPRRLI